ncbi:MAG TPA: hypothetical protein VFQ25_03710 [Ktedonobacterales bacterium]|nr:hypothetical protein [Ktedonobacterales bacterium]
MRQRILVSVAGAALLALGLVVGIIVGPGLQALAAGQQAAQPQVAKGDYCGLYMQTVENELNKTQDQLTTANKDAMQKVIDQMYADGKITQTQKTQAEQELAKYASDPCAALKQMAAKHQSGQGEGTQGQAVTAARAQIEAATAKALGLTQAQLQTDLAKGETVTQLIKTQGVQKSGVDAAYLGAVQSLLKQAVASGNMTQAQSDMAYSYLKSAVAQGHYPLLDKGGAGMMGFPGGQ